MSWDGFRVKICPDYDPSELIRLIPAERVRRHHRSLARAFIGRGGEYLQEIAFHLESAGDRRAAFKYYLKAARAQLHATNRETAAFLIASAAKIGEVEGIHSPKLKRLSADYHYEWEEYGLAAPLYRELLRDAVSLSNREKLRCRIRYLRSAATIGTQRSGYNTQKALLAAAQRLGDPELELEAAYAAFARLSDTAERVEYRQLASEFWRLSQRWPDEIVAVRALCQAALLYMAGGRPELAARTGRYAMERSTHMPASVAFEGHVVQATVEICRGDMPAARTHILAAESLMEVMDQVPRRKLWGVNLGVYYLESGDWNRAEALFHDLYEENKAKAAGRANIVVATNLAILYYEQQKFSEAIHFAGVAQKLDAIAMGDSTPAHAIEGLVLWRDGNKSGAMTKAAEVSRSGAYFGDHSYAALLNATLRAQSSRTQAAAVLASESVRWKRLYYPGSARMELEACVISDPPAIERLRTVALAVEQRGLAPLHRRAMELLGKPV
ncbi:MAG: ATP-binding protein [Longimicrobiales bacterium]